MVDHRVLTRLRTHGATIPVAAGVLAVLLALTSAPSGHQDSAAAQARASATATASTPSQSATITPLASVGGPNADAMRLSLTEPSPTWLEGAYEPDLGAVQDLLDRRSAAAMSADVDGFVATSLTDEPARSQALAIAALPVGEWSYSIGGDDQRGVVLDAETAAARRTFGPDAYVVRTTLRYRLSGYDRTLVTTEHAVTVVHQGGQWWIVRDLPSDGSKEIWDFGRLRVVEGESSLVVGLGGDDAPSRPTLTAYARAADIGVSDVSAVWGSQWQERVLVVAPPTETALGRALGRSASDYGQIAAVTTAELGGQGTVSRGDRVFVNPKAFDQLGENGRTIVLRHEITHVATYAASSDDMPTWIEEGFADYVGYRGAGVSRGAILAELTRWVESGARPSELPADDDYANGNNHLVETYEQSWLAAQMIGDTYGRAKLVRLYVAMQDKTSQSGEQAGTEQAFESVLGISLEAFTRAWSAQVRALAG